MRMVPVVGWINPAARFSNVDFPQPLGPTTDTNDPGRTSKSISRTAVYAPKERDIAVEADRGHYRRV